MKKRGKKSKVNDKHVKFLNEWFQMSHNIGKSFKLGFEALKKRFSKSKKLKVDFKIKACQN